MRPCQRTHPPHERVILSTAIHRLLSATQAALREPTRSARAKASRTIPESRPSEDVPETGSEADTHRSVIPAGGGVAEPRGRPSGRWFPKLPVRSSPTLPPHAPLATRKPPLPGRDPQGSDLSQRMGFAIADALWLGPQTVHEGRPRPSWRLARQAEGPLRCSGRRLARRRSLRCAAEFVLPGSGTHAPGCVPEPQRRARCRVGHARGVLQ
jgi:hypothetical protein